jgi:hypothetical protein|tara:strand:- start:7078 stop:7335 length:258 start_codon:yes stop_codon:yes gene_type:complete
MTYNHLDLLKEDMIDFDKKGRMLMHEYRQEEKSAKVFLTNEGYEVDFYHGHNETKEFLGSEKHHGKSEAWAEDVADNYVVGIKQL